MPLPNTFFGHISPICRSGPLQLFPAVCTKLTKAVVWSLSVHCPGIEFCSECLTTVWNLVLSDWLFSIKLSSWIWWSLLLGASCLKAFRSVEPSSSWHWPESSLSVPDFWGTFYWMATLGASCLSTFLLQMYSPSVLASALQCPKH